MYLQQVKSVRIRKVEGTNSVSTLSPHNAVDMFSLCMLTIGIVLLSSLSYLPPAMGVTSGTEASTIVYIFPESLALANIFPQIFPLDKATDFALKMCK